MAIFRCNLKGCFLDSIRDGTKTVEGRLFKGQFSRLVPGDVIVFASENLEPVSRQIVGVSRYETFEEMLNEEGLRNCLPGIETIEKGVAIYRSFPGYETGEKTFGVVAVRLKP